MEEQNKQLELITVEAVVAEAACLNLDMSIDKCLSGVKQMKKAIEELKSLLEHPFQVEALNNIDGIIDEALIPYLEEVDKEFRNITDA